MRAVQNFVHSDQEILLFSKILKNQVDEDFRQKQLTMVVHLETQIRNHLKSKAWYTSTQHVDRDSQDILQNRVKIEYQVWHKILISLYSNLDVEAMTMLLKNKSYVSKQKE